MLIYFNIYAIYFNIYAIYIHMYAILNDICRNRLKILNWHCICLRTRPFSQCYLIRYLIHNRQNKRRARSPNLFWLYRHYCTIPYSDIWNLINLSRTIAIGGIYKTFKYGDRLQANSLNCNIFAFISIFFCRSYLIENAKIFIGVYSY